MTDLDKQIEDALNAEDSALLDAFPEQGLIAQWFSLYRGPEGWIASLSTVIMAALALTAFYAIWQVFGVGGEDTMQWAALAWLMMTMLAFMKVWFWMRMESNRVIREIKRVELQIARLRTASGA